MIKILVLFLSILSSHSEEPCKQDFRYLKRINTCVPKYITDCNGKFIKQDNKCIHPLYNVVFDVKKSKPVGISIQKDIINTRKDLDKTQKLENSSNHLTDQSEYYQNYLVVSGSYYMAVSDRLKETNSKLLKDIKNQESEKDVNLTNFKCNKNKTKVPGMTNDISYTEANILYRCKQKQALEEAKEKSFSAYKYTNDVLRNLLIENKENKKIVDQIAPPIVKPVDLYTAAPELASNQEEVNNNSSNENSTIKEAQSTCGPHDRFCEGKPKFPSSGDYTFKGITCQDIRKANGDEWQNRYDYVCRNNKVILLSKNYMWVKGASCQSYFKAKKNAIIFNKTEDTFVRESKLFYTHHGCAGDTMVTIRRLRFKPISCKEIGKNLEIIGGKMERRLQ